MRVHRNCGGLDVHKKMIAACLIREDGEGNGVTEKRLFGSMTRELHALAQWLCAAQVTAVAMRELATKYNSCQFRPFGIFERHNIIVTRCDRAVFSFQNITSGTN